MPTLVRYRWFVTPDRSASAVGRGVASVSARRKRAAARGAIGAAVDQAVANDGADVPPVRTVSLAVSNPGHVPARPGEELVARNLERTTFLGIQPIHVLTPLPHIRSLEGGGVRLNIGLVNDPAYTESSTSWAT